jgi:hypothetical protein
MKQLLLLIATFVVTNISLAQTYSGGAGTKPNPYLIANKADLKFLSENSVDWNKHFKQTANINFTSSDFAIGGAFYNAGEGFIPIGLTGSFTGSYNGQHYSIDSLKIVRPNTIYSVGLFASVNSSDTLKNIAITNCNIQGFEQVGGLAGSIHNEIILNSSATGSISGVNVVGGLIGMNYRSIISNSYSTCSVSGDIFIAGLVGRNYESTISNSYAAGYVSGDVVGGLAGLNEYSTISNSYATGAVVGAGGGLLASYDSGSITNCFWDIQTTGQSTSDGGGIGLDTTSMKMINTFTSAGWDFVGEAINGAADIWQMGVCNLDGSSYPILSWQVGLSGSGSAIDPYLIQSKNNLKTLSENPCLWNQHFKQTANINFTSADFSMGGAFYNAGDCFSPIGNGSTNFTGSYNGQGFSIDSLKINRPGGGVGLFGVVSTLDSLKNIAITKCNIQGLNSVGSLAGLLNVGTISNSYATVTVNGSIDVGGLVGRNTSGFILNSYATGAVSGSNTVGGLVGFNEFGTISKVYATVAVSGTNFIGGLLGKNDYGTISNSYATGSISGSNFVGGLVGNINDGVISNSYATGANNGSNSTGGLVGANDEAIITNCFWDTLTTGQNLSGGGTGKNSLEMKTLATFTSATWDFITETTNGTADIWQMNCGTNNGYPVFSWQALNAEPVLTTNITSQTNVTCNGGNNGEASLSTSGGTAAYNYLWSNGVTVSNNTNLIAGVYTYTVTDANACAQSNTVTITEPAAINIATITNELIITAVANGLTYQWIDCATNLAIAGEMNQTYTATVNGNYKVAITDGICSDTSACVAITTVGLKENLNSLAVVRAYPNPITSVLIIELSGTNETYDVELTNTLGQVVLSETSKGKNLRLATENLNAGVYFVKVKNHQPIKIIKN